MLLGLDKRERELAKAMEMQCLQGMWLCQRVWKLWWDRRACDSQGNCSAAAARMFVRQPELLVFDDLSSALDVETEQKLWEHLFAAGNLDNRCSGDRLDANVSGGVSPPLSSAPR